MALPEQPKTATPQPDPMRSARFRAEREREWERLTHLLDRAGSRGMPALSFEEASELGALYRRTAHALALAREISLDRALLDYLEALSARAYLAVYAPQETFGAALRRFLASSGPATVRRRWGVVALALLCLAFGHALGQSLVAADPSWYGAFVPEPLAAGRGPGASADELRAALYDAQLAGLDDLSAFAASLFSHNARVAIFAFALGLLGGWATVLLTVHNGTILGAFFAVHAHKGLAFDLFAWLSVHGVTELTAIALAAGGGLVIAGAILFPGRRTRVDALRRAGGDAARLVTLAAIMLLAAGLLEGYARQLVQDPWARITLGWGVGALWLAWFVLAGRGGHAGAR